MKFKAGDKVLIIDKTKACTCGGCKRALTSTALKKIHIIRGVSSDTNVELNIKRGDYNWVWVRPSGLRLAGNIQLEFDFMSEEIK